MTLAPIIIFVVVLAVVAAWMFTVLRRIPFTYNFGNMKARRVSTTMSILGIGVVIAVMLSMMALRNGVEKATVSSGSKENLLVMREGAEAELSSWVSKDAYHIIRTMPGVAKSANGEPVISPEVVILFKLPKKDNPKGSNVLVRGVSPAAFAMRPYVKLIAGRMFNPGLNEVIVARRIRDRFVNANIGDSFQFGPQVWKVVGVFEAGGTAFDSEMWADLDYLGQARKREAYSSVLVRTSDPASLASLREAIKGDNRLKLAAKSEYQYYSDQTKGLLGIRVLVSIVTFFMIIGAVLGTMNTMFSAIASRGRELATLRALGFKRRTVIGSVVIESAFVALLGGLTGLILAFPVNGVSTGTTNWSTFSEVAFNFNIDAAIATRGLVLAVIAGIIGGILPALSAARLPIPTALREI